MADKDLQAALKTQFGTSIASGFGGEDGYRVPETVAKVYAPSSRYFDTTGVKTLNVKPMEGELGSYSPKVPGQVNIDPKEISEMNEYLARHNRPSYNPKNIFVHEQQHLKDFESGRVSPIDAGGPFARVPLDDVAKVRDQIETVKSKYKEKYNLSDDFVGSGFFPELASIQSSLPVGKNIFDTDIGKDLLKIIPTLKTQLYSATTPLGGTEIHSPNLPGESVKSVPMSKEQSLIDMIRKAQDYIRNLTAP